MVNIKVTYYIYQKSVKIQKGENMKSKTEINIDSLRTLIGQKTGYPQLCNILNLEKKGGDAKKSQLKEIQAYCEMSRTEDKKYLITEVYDDDIIEFVDFLNLPRQQLLFNIALYKQILANGEKLLFCSNTQLLKLLGEVNDNFAYTFNESNLLKLSDDNDEDDLVYMASMTKTVYNILLRWTKRKINNMGFAVVATPAFRLYKDVYTDYGKVIKFDNVAFGTPLFSRCQRVMNQAVKETIDDPKYINRDEQTGEIIGFKWMPEGLWLQLEETINKLTKTEFAKEGYTRLNVITAFSPASGDTIQKKMENACQRVKELDDINLSAQKKIMETTQLSRFTEGQRQQYIEYNISSKPPKLFKEELKQLRIRIQERKEEEQ